MVLTATHGERAERQADTDGGAIHMAAAPSKPGALTLDQVHDVMSELSRQRPAFHSEADFQHAFAQLLVKRHPSLNVRLEIPYRVIGSSDLGPRTVVDLFCSDSAGGGVTAIEFKYRTRRWSGSVDGEAFQLLHHSAADLGRRYFVNDISRLERWFLSDGGTAFVIFLTNDGAYWSVPPGQVSTNDAAFRIHEGVNLTGELRWANNLYPGNTRTLRGRFPMQWSDYSDLSLYADGKAEGSKLRCVVAAVVR
ncbi:hypothetical protein [Brachybacterium sp. SW0106-09]|uniref:hypothetical protein n=1 Tax=Brachybacterium sp. SW0106-09 TaxID=1704590 RepID=UPI0006B5E496|nr:hypothetical protein [Brachybacterium sp. SW0106-09]